MRVNARFRLLRSEFLRLHTAAQVYTIVLGLCVTDGRPLKFKPG